MIKYIYNQILYLQGSGWFYLEGVWLWRISGAITGDDGVGFRDKNFLNLF